MIYSPLRILILESNPDIRNMIGRLLQLHGYTVSLQNKFTNFITEVVEIHPNIVIIDKNLGWADGCELCILIKTNDITRDTPVIMLSAYPLSEAQCLAAGADAFIEKPFDIELLLDAIERLCSQ